jgi:hypothetical protein
MPTKEGAVPLNAVFAKLEEAHATWSIPPMAEFVANTEKTVMQTRHPKKMINETSKTDFRQPVRVLCLTLRRKTFVQHHVHFLWQRCGHCGQHCGEHALQQQQSHARSRTTAISKGVQTSTRRHVSSDILSSTSSDDFASANQFIISGSSKGARLMYHCDSSLSSCSAVKISTPSQYARANVLASSAALVAATAATRLE